jgi:uncharacterized protein
VRARRLRYAVTAAALALVAPASPAAAAPPDYPKAAGWVLDQAAVINSAEETALERRLSAYEKKTGHEIAVVTIKTLGGARLETYATGLFNTWGIGKAGKNNGVLLLVAMQERKLRLEVGRGLEAVITDEEAGTILDDHVRPAMRTEDVIGAVTAGVDGIVSQLTRGPVRRTPAAPMPGDPATAEERSAEPQSFVDPSGGSGGPSDPTFLVVGGLILGAAVVVGAWAVGSRSGSRRGAGGRWQDHSTSTSTSPSGSSFSGSDSGGASDGGGSSGGW